MFVVHSEDIRESWIAAIKKLQPKGEIIPLNDYDIKAVAMMCIESMTLLPVV